MVDFMSELKDINYVTLSAKIIKRHFMYEFVQMDLDEAIQASAIDIWKYKKRWDPNKGTFLTYAYWSVKSTLNKLWRKESTVRNWEVKLDGMAHMDVITQKPFTTTPEYNFIEVDAFVEAQTDKRTKDIVKHTLMGFSAKAVGDKVGLKRSRVDQIYKKAITTYHRRINGIHCGYSGVTPKPHKPKQIK